MHAVGSDRIKYASYAWFSKTKLRIERLPPAFQVSRLPRQLDRPITTIVGRAWKESDEECFLFQNSFLFIFVFKISIVLFRLRMVSAPLTYESYAEHSAP